MSNYSAEQLYRLLPAVYRQRDAEQGPSPPLRELIEIIAGQAQVIERDVLQLYESWFIETCEPWVVPYVGDLIGVRSTHGRMSRRSEVANTLGYRRAKGTAAVLEQLAHDVTGWPARVVEYFERLGTTQYINHVRPQNLRTPDLRRTNELELLGGPFETASHTVDVRRIAIERGRYNIPNVGLFLWRLQPYPLERVMPRPVDADHKNFTFNALGLDEPLFNAPETESSATHIAEEINVPAPIRRRAFHADPKSHYGPSLEIWADDTPVPVGQIVACDLADWNRPRPNDKVAVDPVLGRLSFPAAKNPDHVRVSYHYGFSDALGGGPYPRAASFSHIAGGATFKVGEGADSSTLQDALAKWNGEGSAVIEILDSRTYKDTYEEELNVPEIPQDANLEIRAADGQRPTLLLQHSLTISGAERSGFELNGLLVAGAPLKLTGKIDRVHLQHSTLAPGGNAPALVIEADSAQVTIERSILGTVRTGVETQVSLRDSIVDGGPLAFAGFGGEPGGPLTVSRCTVIGEVSTHQLVLAEDSLFRDKVIAERRQEGCVRFSYLPADSRTPRRYRCQPEGGALSPAPRFTSLRYGDPGYCQLTTDTPCAIRRGAADESEMGAFSSLRQPQREDALRLRFEEYLRVGLEAGIFFAT